MNIQQKPKEPATAFRRWSRKNFAVFSSMKKTVRIGVLSLSCSILTLPAWAQQNQGNVQLQLSETDPEISLEEVVVSAQRSPVVYSELMRVVHVITRKEIEQSAARDIAGLLESLPGVDMRQRGPADVQSDISLRGGTFDQTLVLLNGVNISDPQTGHHALNLPIDILAIERIEVLKGPAARVYGPNAFNGAINIITIDPRKSQLKASIKAGSHATYAASVLGSYGQKTAGILAAASYSDSKGFIANTDFGNFKLFLSGDLTKENARIFWNAGINDKSFGAHSFYTPRFPEQFEATRLYFVNVSGQIGSGIQLKPSVYWRRHYDRFELFRYQAPPWYAGHNYHVTDVAGGGLSSFILSKLGKTSAGLDARHEQILSNVLGKEMAEPVKVRGEGDALYKRSDNRQSMGLMVEHAMLYKSFTFSAGSLIYYHTAEPSRIRVFPGIEAGWQICPALRWFASAQKGLRMPTFTDLYYSGPAHVGNSQLKPEEVISLETGLKSHAKAAQAEISVFRNYGRNLIDWVRRPQEEIWYSMNQTQMVMTGLEAFASVFLSRLAESYFFIEKIGMGYSYLHAENQTADWVSRYAMDHLKHKLDINAGFNITSKLLWQWNASWQWRNGHYQKYEDGAFSAAVPFEPVWLLDCKLQYAFSHFKAFASVSNLLNETLPDFPNVPQPGRWLGIGLEMHFNAKK